MADTVSVPGVKKPLPKWAVFGGVGIVGLLVFQYYRSKSSGSAAQQASQAASTTDQYPPDGTTGDPTDPYSTDPATGQTYGNEAAGSGGTYGAFGGGGGTGSGGGGSGTPGPYTVPGGPPFASNSAWADWAIQELTATNPMVDVGALTDALGAYLAGAPVDAAQKTLIFDALAIAGDPPVAGPGGYPPKVLANGGKGGGGGGGSGGGGGGGSGGNPGGRITGGGPGIPGQPHGLTAVARYTQADLSWRPVRNATRYRVRAWTATAHVQVIADVTVTTTRTTLHNLPEKTRIGWHVQALDPAGGGPWSVNAHFTTR